MDNSSSGSQTSDSSQNSILKDMASFTDFSKLLYKGERLAAFGMFIVLIVLVSIFGSLAYKFEIKTPTLGVVSFVFVFLVALLGWVSVFVYWFSDQQKALREKDTQLVARSEKLTILQQNLDEAKISKIGTQREQLQFLQKTSRNVKQLQLEIAKMVQERQTPDLDSIMSLRNIASELHANIEDERNKYEDIFNQMNDGQILVANASEIARFDPNA